MIVVLNESLEVVRTPLSSSKVVTWDGKTISNISHYTANQLAELLIFEVTEPVPASNERHEGAAQFTITGSVNDRPNISVSVSYTTITISDADLLAAARTRAYSKARINYERAANDLKSVYNQAEMNTFYKQEEEARAHQADSNASTPFLDAYVLQYQTLTGADNAAKKATLVTQIMNKVNDFQGWEGDLIGQLKAHEAAIAAAATAAAVDALDLSFTDPSAT